MNPEPDDPSKPKIRITNMSLTLTHVTVYKDTPAFLVNGVEVRVEGGQRKYRGISGPKDQAMKRCGAIAKYLKAEGFLEELFLEKRPMENPQTIKIIDPDDV